MKLLGFRGGNLFSLGKVELDLTNRGLLLVTGYSADEGSANGAGKSSLASKGPMWVLWGVTPSGLKADRVVNRHMGKKKAWGEVDFIGIDGERYTVRRERPAKLCLFKRTSGDDVDLTLTKAVDTQKLIDSLLGRDFKTFSQVDFFGQGRAMSYASLTPKDQKALLENILPMDKIDTWIDYTSTQKRELDGVLNNILRDLSNQLHSLKSFKATEENFTEKLYAWDKNRTKEITDLENKINSNELNRGMTRRIELIDEEIAKLKETQPQPVPLEEIDAADAAASESGRCFNESHQSRIAWEQKLISYKSMLLDADKIEENICPTCGTNLTADVQQVLRARTESLNKQIADAEQNAKDAVTAENYYRNLRDNDSQRLHDLHQQNKAVVTVDVKISNLEKEKNSIESNIKIEQSKMHSMLESLKKEENPWYQSLKETKITVNGLTESTKKLASQQDMLEEEIEHIQFWLDFYSKELKLRLFEATCPFLDDRTSHHLRGLQNEQIHVEFSTIKRLASGDIKDEFTTHVWSDTGGDGFDSLSGGEQQIVSFAIGLALADLASSQVQGASSFLILDEPFSQLDARNSEAIVEYLTGDLGKGKDTTLLISNEDELKTLIPNRVHVIKKHGVSNIEV